MTSTHPTFPSLSELVSSLRRIADEQITCLREAVPEVFETVRAEDHLVIAALRRSLDNTIGILAMADQRNIFCGMPIVRFQIDTAMCLFARTLVDEISDFVTHIAEGKKLSDYKDRTGRKLTDAYLREELDKKHPMISDSYVDASGYVHFSTQHLHRVLDLTAYRQNGELRFKKIDDLTIGWDEEEVKGALVTFMWASDAILVECEEWQHSHANHKRTLIANPKSAGQTSPGLESIE